jgi:hypothetical protein
LNSFLTNLAANGRRTDILERIETPAAALTLTRSATLAITTAGTLISWQTETRNRGVNWSGTDITIPTNGYYQIQTFLQTSASVNLTTQRVVNGVNLGLFVNASITTTYHPGAMMRYFSTGDILQIRVIPSSNVNLIVSAENAIAESPLLHITQITGAV